VLSPSFSTDVLRRLATEQINPPGEESSHGSGVLFIGNLPQGTTREYLYDLMNPFGRIKGIKEFTNLASAHITFQSRSSVTEVLRAYAHDTIRVQGQEVIMHRTVNPEAEERRIEEVLDGYSNRDVGLSVADVLKAAPARGTIFVTGYGPGTMPQDLHDTFRVFGKIDHIRWSELILSPFRLLISHLSVHSDSVEIDECACCF